MPNRLLLWDVAAIFVFVVVGRRTHQEAETVRATLETAAPFMFALPFGWVAASFGWAPASLRGGLVVAPFTIVGGVVLRRLVAGDGIAAPFIIVTAIFLSATMIGWRVAAGRVRRRTEPEPSGVGAG